METIIQKTPGRTIRVDGTNSRTTGLFSRPKRSSRQPGSKLQQAWDSLERLRFNLAATVAAIDNLERNLTEFEVRRTGDTDAEKIIDELEPNPLPFANIDGGIIAIANSRIEARNSPGDREPEFDFDGERDVGFSPEPEKDDGDVGTVNPEETPENKPSRDIGKNLGKGSERLSSRKLRGFDLDL